MWIVLYLISLSFANIKSAQLKNRKCWICGSLYRLDLLSRTVIIQYGIRNICCKEHVLVFDLVRSLKQETTSWTLFQVGPLRCWNTSTNLQGLLTIHIEFKQAEVITTLLPPTGLQSSSPCPGLCPRDACYFAGESWDTRAKQYREIVLRTPVGSSVPYGARNLWRQSKKDLHLCC